MSFLIVLVYAETYLFVTKWGSFGFGDGQFTGLRGVAMDSSNNIYVTDSGNDRVQKFTSTGTYITQWGSAGSGYGQFLGPYGVAMDRSGNVYVIDYHNYRVQKFAL